MPEPLIFPLFQFKSGNQRILVKNIITALEGIMSVQQNVLLGHRLYPGQSLNPFGIAFRFLSFQESRQDCQVVVNDSVGNQLPALVTEHCLNVIFPG